MPAKVTYFTWRQQFYYHMEVLPPQIMTQLNLGGESHVEVFLPLITWGGVISTAGAPTAGIGVLGVGEGLTQDGSELGATLLP